MTESSRLTDAQAAEVLRRSRPIPTQRASAPSAVSIVGADLDGRAARLELPAAEPTLLLFLSPTCLGCADLFAAAAEPSSLGMPDGHVQVVLRAEPEAEERPLVGSAALVAPDAWAAYGVTGPPFFSLVLASSPTVVTEGVAWGAASVAEAVEAALSGRDAPRVVRLDPGASS